MLVEFGSQPDEDAGHTDPGRVPLSELVKAGRHRPELLAAVHQPLHLIALPVAGPVKGRRPATPSPPPGPVGLLILPLRDGVTDTTGPQCGPVGPAAVGLVAGQMGHPGAGPTVPTRAGHPHRVHQPDQLAGIGVLPRGEAGGQVAATPITDRVQLGGQPTP